MEMQPLEDSTPKSLSVQDVEAVSTALSSDRHKQSIQVIRN